MSFVLFDLSFLVIFSLIVGIFLFIERKKLVKEGIMFLYKTQIGIKILDYIGKKYKRTLSVLSYVVVFTGYILMIFSVYFIAKLLYYFTNPAFVQAVKVPPIMPLIPYLPELFNVTWLPPFYFTYWIIAIAVIAIFHEGAHGIFARFYNIRIKSTGFGFLGPFLAFFVEQDDKQMVRASPYKQMTLLAAGVFANVLIGFVFFLLLVAFANFAYTASGVSFTDYSYSVMNASIIGSAAILNDNLQVDGKNLTHIEVNNKSYFILPEFLKLDYNGKDKNKLIPLYQDLPAIRVSLVGAVTQINGNKIKNLDGFRTELDKYSPGDKITLTTEYIRNDALIIHTYDLVLAKDPQNESRPLVGIATLNPHSEGLRGMTQNLISFFKEPAVYYKPKINVDFAKFMYDFLWWMFLINLSVAVANMIPLGIFDGGRFFYLTILLVTKKEKVAEKAFKWMTWFLIGLIILMMIFWAFGMF